MPWTVGEQPRSGSGESPGPGARGSGRDLEERNQARALGSEPWIPRKGVWYLLGWGFTTRA